MHCHVHFIPRRAGDVESVKAAFSALYPGKALIDAVVAHEQLRKVG